ncbi:MAG: hypothetical protein SGI84_11580, partial [Gemmatimonadota bacterium]|nr:hypothetical protein [Gemmatimonadota bacterium]
MGGVSNGEDRNSCPAERERDRPGCSNPTHDSANAQFPVISKGDPMAILLTDDSPVVIAGIRHFLEADGQQVESTTDPAHAKALLLASDWEALILGFLAGNHQAGGVSHLQRMLELDRGVPIL